MPDYIYEHPDWPAFTWDKDAVAEALAAVSRHQGRLIGRMEGLGFALTNEAVLQTLTQDVLKSSEIEGEILDPDQVRSSIARRLGMNVGGLPKPDRDVEGVVEMMLDATQRYDQPLTTERLFAWHSALFPTGRSGMKKIIVGGWRDDSDGPMQVVSGPVGRERVHYEAPEAGRVPADMDAFLAWFNDDSAQLDGVLKAALAHLWFVTIHPFEDGNGRSARAVADMALARSEGTSQRFYSMSAQVRLERKTYYDLLERTQKGSLDITPWLLWFLDCLDRAFDGAEETLAAVLRKAHFWETHGQDFSDRQRRILNMLLDGFEGKLTSTKYAIITKCSQDTASRDIADLLARNVLVKGPAGGRSTSYELAEIPNG